MEQGNQIQTFKIDSEEDLRDSFLGFLKESDIEDFAKEVNLFGYHSIDVVYIDKDRHFICVELKLHNWKRVLEQAKLRKMATQLVYVAMPVPKTQRKRKLIEEECAMLGIGLFWLNDRGVWIQQFMPEEHTIKSLDIYFNPMGRSFYYNKHWTFLNRCIETKKD